MSSRFVSAGTTSDPKPTDSSSSTSPSQHSPSHQTARDVEWAATKSSLEQDRLARIEAANNPNSNDGKTLYEILQENKAAKQEAFEESIKLKNQFRALNDEEIEFLEETRERERADEERAREEERRGLEEFRKAREQDDKDTNEQAGVVEMADEENDWATTAKKKRKRLKGGEGLGLKGVKMRKASSGGVENVDAASNKAKNEEDKNSSELESKTLPSELVESIVRTTTVQKQPNSRTLESKEVKNKTLATSKTSSAALVSYDSDDDDD